MIRRNQKPGGQSGFTLVELLVVISVLIILAGVTVSVLNPKKQRQKTEDGIMLSNLEKLAVSVESYANANGKYPAGLVDAAPADGVPDDPELKVFISKIPNGEPTAGVVYTYEAAADQASFTISVPKATDTASCYKYYSSWGKVRECAPCDAPDGCVVSLPTPTPTPPPACLALGGTCFSSGACCSGVCGTDADGDNYMTSATTGTCQAATKQRTDCNDGNAAVHPGATEICSNGIDEDCNGADLACYSGVEYCSKPCHIGIANQPVVEFWRRVQDSRTGSWGSWEWYGECGGAVGGTCVPIPDCYYWYSACAF